MAQSSLRQFYTVRKRPQEEHGSIKRRKLAEDTRLDIPSLSKDADPLSLPFTQPQLVSTAPAASSKTRPTTTDDTATSSAASSKTRPATTDTSAASSKTKLVAKDTTTSSATSSKTRPATGGSKKSTRRKVRGRGQTTLSQRRRNSPTLPATPSIVLPSSPLTEHPSQPHSHTTATDTEPPHTSTDPSSQQLSTSANSGDAVRHLYKLSARELAQPTPPERARVTRATAMARQTRGKSPATPSPQLHQFKSFVVKSPTKSPSKQPAYQRFHSLAQAPAAETPDLPLPYKYQVLLEKFRCTDTVVTMLQKRREICTFNKLKQAVEEMTRRKYENRNLGQMETVYPRAFIFRQEKNIPGIYDQKTFESYQLTVECNVREDGSVKSEECEEGDGEKEKVNVVLDSSALLRRRKVFNRNLCKITRQHHKQFLLSLDPPLEIPDEKVLRWHPAFQLDSLPDIEEAELPKPPLTEAYTTAQDVLNVAQAKLAPRVQQALEGVARNSKSKEEESAREGPGSSHPPHPAVTDPALRGVSQKLLEKIQQKEACRVRSDLTRDPVKERKLEMLTRLPQLTRIIRSLFVTEKKAAIPFDTVVQKLQDSHSSCLPPDGLEDHLELMQESLGGWLTVVEVRKKRFVKINKNTDTQVLNARMDTARKKLLT